MEDIKGNLFTTYAIGMNNNNNSDLREKVDDEIILDFVNQRLDIVQELFRRRV